MELATNLGNMGYFTSALLDMLAQETIFYVAREPGATIVNEANLRAGENLNSRLDPSTADAYAVGQHARRLYGRVDKPRSAFAPQG